MELELKISDKINLPADSFTYVSDTHGTCSWLDHVVSSKSAHDSIDPNLKMTSYCDVKTSK